MGVIEIEGLVKKYGNNLAVNNLDLDIEGGKVYGFLGPNGAGKSTTMNIITGYIGATSGIVKVAGYDIFKEANSAKEKIGYLPEQPPLYPEMTVEEYLNYVAELKKIPKKDREKAIEMAVEKTGIKEIYERLIRNLSKGFKQRVGIAQAIINMPEVIILDEPTVGLDPIQIIEIRELIRSLGEDHTVILSSHLLTEVSEVCDYIYVISRGELVAEGTEEELTKGIVKENILEVTIQGDKIEVEGIIQNISGITSYEFADAEGEGVTLIIRSGDGSDVRTELFSVCAANNIPILGMNYKSNSLEDAFVELTEEYEAPEKKSIFKKKKRDEEIEIDTVEEVSDNESNL